LLIGENSTLNINDSCSHVVFKGYENLIFGKACIVGVDCDGGWISVDPNWIVLNSPQVKMMNSVDDEEGLARLVYSLRSSFFS
jgi:hypothetical protein